MGFLRCAFGLMNMRMFCKMLSLPSSVLRPDEEECSQPRPKYKTVPDSSAIGLISFEDMVTSNSKI